MIQYNDGNNNTWTIDKESIKYIPVSAIMSSSGSYSGGKSEKYTITQHQHEDIIRIINEALIDSSSHQQFRNMGTAMIKIENKKCILSSCSPHLKRIEDWLNSL